MDYGDISVGAKRVAGSRNLLFMPALDPMFSEIVLVITTFQPLRIFGSSKSGGLELYEWWVGSSAVVYTVRRDFPGEHQ